MILNTPTAEQFHLRGLDYLNLGWSNIVKALSDFEYADEQTIHGLLPGFKTEFLGACERELATALSLVCQGVEFLLKAKICKISEWALLKDFTKQCKGVDLDFSEFITLDAQDLILVHDTVTGEKLSEEFKLKFDELRKQRNSIMHSIASDISPKIAELIENTLIMAENLLGEHTWYRNRKQFFERDRFGAFYDDLDERLVREFVVVNKWLNPAELKRFFNVEKRRLYRCPSCRTEDGDSTVKTAQLKEKGPQSRLLYCFTCQQDFPVLREDCIEDECPGNVIDAQHAMCLTCGGYN